MRKFSYQKDLEGVYRTLIRLAIDEDIGRGDITTQAMGQLGKALGQGEVVVKEDGVVICGLQVGKILFSEKISSRKSKVVSHCRDGDELRRGDRVLTLTAPIDDLLRWERILLNFLQHLSGIATQTRKWVRDLPAGGIRLLDTRKTLPGYRILEKYAVFCGGGENHRMGLFDQYLIKDNHIEIAGGTLAAMERVMADRKSLLSKASAKKGLRVEIECRNLKEVKEVLDFNRRRPAGDRVDMIMLDNFSLKEIRQALPWIRKEGNCQVEVSGNMDLPKIRKLIALREPGIDYISAGALTHSVAAVDLSMRIKHV